MNNFGFSDSPRMVAVYIRVSSKEQDIDGYSPEHQRTRLLQYIQENKSLNITTRDEYVFKDVGTGATLNRPGLDKVRALAKAKKIQGVLVWKIDRLSRDLSQLLTLFEEFQQHGVGFTSLQEHMDFNGPIGQLIFQFFGAIAQFERSLIRGRTRAGIISSAEQGNYIGSSVPYGYNKVKRTSGKGSILELNKDEQHWVVQIYDWYIYHNMGDLVIANELNRLSVPSREGLKRSRLPTWSEPKVRKILTNSLYFGKHVAIKRDEDGRLLPADKHTIVWFPGCVSELTFQQAQRTRELRVSGHSKNEYLLSGKLWDVSPELPNARHMCGAKRTKGGFSYRRKRFIHADSGTIYPNFEIPAKPLDDFVWSRIMAAFDNPMAFVEKYMRLDADGDAVDAINAKLHTLRQRKVQIEAVEIQNAESALLKGVFSEDQYARVATRTETELETVKTDIKKLEQDLRGLAAIRSNINSLKRAAKEVSKKVENLPFEQQKIICGLFVDRVEITRTDAPKGQKEKRQVTADIYFRFNLEQLQSPIGVGCTAKDLSETGLTTSSDSENVTCGGTRRQSYINIHITAQSSFSHEVRFSKGQYYPHRQVVWKELLNAQ